MTTMNVAAEEVFKNRNRFIIVGLTGRSGSGCSKAAEMLSSEFQDLALPPVCLSETSTDHDRKKFIIYNFAKKNWKKFFKIKVSDIITTFILECTFKEFSDYIFNNFNKDLSSLKKQFNDYYNKNKCLDKVITENYASANKELIYSYISEDLSTFSCNLRLLLGNINDGSGYTSIYQEIGNNIRKYGAATPQNEVSVENIYSIPDRINKLIKILRKHPSKLKNNSYFVIDAFRNPLEAMFFQERYSAFYLFAVRCSEEERIDRLINAYNFSRGKISQIDSRETPKKYFLDNINNFLSQDIATCIQIADIYINNPGKHENQNYNALKEQLTRYVSLIQHPGMINPSKDEKLMQMAFTAKLNSGCLSRKVGAIVTNRAGSPKAIGWNSSPEGQTPCLLRNVPAMINNTDPCSYSQYEKTNPDMTHLAKEYIRSFDEALEERGLNCSFCFKDFQNKKEGKGNQVHNRSLHAEENAFLQVAKFGGEGVVGGSLYTTAAPCDLCSRKAYQLGIKKIFYIDPYPGIAVEHVLMVGQEPPYLVLFHGAIGSAYHKLYSSIIPYKDELYSYLATNLFRKSKETFSLP